ncbi:hypothetical protein [Xanthocytophaga agilis]|uniref:Uncharacterized protein n=1 Tax=Xanthocytophaga agilis TaxID=3048010 RepID=A0AAE3UFE7_9BACT|nr:hypothetical protein [Xanthocytophaga agilis]MDJ1500493.1 hypothetical protein [Xanthocytophaga agilis]
MKIYLLLIVWIFLAFLCPVYGQRIDKKTGLHKGGKRSYKYMSERQYRKQKPKPLPKKFYPALVKRNKTFKHHF